MPCFACYGCGKCIRADAHKRRCIVCHERLAEDVEVCPACGRTQPPRPGVVTRGEKKTETT